MLQKKRIWLVAGITGVVIAAGCRMEDPSDREVENFDSVKTPAASAHGPSQQSVHQVSAPVPVEDWATAEPRVMRMADSADRMLRKVPNLTRWEQVKLRRDVNL